MDKQTGEPVKARISLADVAPEVVADENGYYKIIVTHFGKHHLRIDAPGYHGAGYYFVLEPDHNYNVEFELIPGRDIVN